jgi:hypothetical protein
MAVQVADFDLIYTEIITIDGTSLVERCGHQIFGRSFVMAFQFAYTWGFFEFRNR